MMCVYVDHRQASARVRGLRLVHVGFQRLHDASHPAGTQDLGSVSCVLLLHLHWLDDLAAVGR